MIKPFEFSAKILNNTLKLEGLNEIKDDITSAINHISSPSLDTKALTSASSNLGDTLIDFTAINDSARRIADITSTAVSVRNTADDFVNAADLMAGKIGDFLISEWSAEINLRW